MPVEVVTTDQIPRSRYQWSPLYETEEWKQCIAQLEKGLAKGQAVCLQWSEETAKALRMGDLVQASTMALKRLIARRKWNYKVIQRHILNEALPRFYIVPCSYQVLV